MTDFGDGTPVIIVRPAQPADFGRIAEIWLASASMPGVAPIQIPTVDQLTTRIATEMAEDWTLMVAVQDETIVGMLAMKIGAAILDQLFVAPSAIRSGVGRQLLDHAMTAMPSGFTLHTADSNTNAQHFYEAAGLTRLSHAIHPRTKHPIVYYGWQAS